MTEPRTIEVVCPGCKGSLTVDASTGEVILHVEGKIKPTLDLNRAAQTLKEDEARRRDAFQKSLQAEKNKGESLQKKFEEAVRRAKERPDEPPPLRPVDLD
jgi:uncharacterized protein YbaR (Trm112 family)